MHHRRFPTEGQSVPMLVGLYGFVYVDLVVVASVYGGLGRGAWEVKQPAFPLSFNCHTFTHTLTHTTTTPITVGHARQVRGVPGHRVRYHPLPGNCGAWRDFCN